jgi:pyridoxine 5-phosphate synthase
MNSLGIHKTALSVNINKIALLRNTRHLDVPNVLRAAELSLQAGARGITVHPRPDERHIRGGDVFEIAALMKDWPDREFNVEGNPLQNLMDFVRDLSARGLPIHQCTFVPDSHDQFTSDHGWSFPHDLLQLQPLIAQAHARGVRVSLFMDPVPAAMAAAKQAGADRVELYTESFASAFNSAHAGAHTGSHARAQLQTVLARFVETAQAAIDVGLGINAGHDLSRANLTEFLTAVPGVLEVSIGHALIADALEMGLDASVKAYQACIDEAEKAVQDKAENSANLSLTSA